MRATVVIYSSQTGFTERYARWIAEELGCPLYSLKEIGLEELKPYSMVIFGGGIFAGFISKLGKIKRWMEKDPEKTWVVFATGATPPTGAYVQLIQKTNFPKGESRPAHFFYFLSGINYEKMSLWYRLAMWFFNVISNFKQRKTDGGSWLNLKSNHKSVDLCNYEYIQPLVNYVEIKRK